MKRIEFEEKNIRTSQYTILYVHHKKYTYITVYYIIRTSQYTILYIHHSIIYYILSCTYIFFPILFKTTLKFLYAKLISIARAENFFILGILVMRLYFSTLRMSVPRTRQAGGLFVHGVQSFSIGNPIF